MHFKYILINWNHYSNKATFQSISFGNHDKLFPTEFSLVMEYNLLAYVLFIDILRQILLFFVFHYVQRFISVPNYLFAASISILEVLCSLSRQILELEDLRFPISLSKVNRTVLRTLWAIETSKSDMSARSQICSR